MEHEVAIDSQVELPDRIHREAILALMTHVLESEGVVNPWALGIQFVDGLTMQAAHLEFMDIDEPTDIMTFPYTDEDDVWGADQYGGDLMISVDQARINAADVGWEEDDELFFLIAHGLLHLLGWDDHSDVDRERMLARQRELLDSWEQRPSRADSY